VLLGYTYRWWPPLRDLRARVHAGEVGRVLHVQCTMSAHLADWHPWEPYNAFFMASADLGGGALLDESHFIDLMVWLFGTPTAARGSVARIGPLDIQTDDTVDALLEFKGGPRCLIHLDLYGRPHEKWIRITGDKGSLHWSFDPNEVRVATGAEQQWSATSYTWVRNDMFVECAKEFVAMMDGRELNLTCTLDDGIATMRVIEALRRSEARGTRESV
jgi:predicted dehydrogenase